MNRILTILAVVLFVNIAQADIYGSFKLHLDIDKTSSTDKDNKDTTITTGEKLDDRNYVATDIRLGFKGESSLSNDINIEYRLELQTTENKTLTAKETELYLVVNKVGKFQVGPLYQGVKISTANLDNWHGVNLFSDIIGGVRDSGGDGFGYSRMLFDDTLEIVLNLGTGKDSDYSSFYAQTGLATIYTDNDYKVSFGYDRTAANSSEGKATNNKVSYEPTTTIMVSGEYTYDKYTFGLAFGTTDKGAISGDGTVPATATNETKHLYFDVFYDRPSGADYRFGYGTNTETQSGIITKTTKFGLEAIYALGKNTDSFAGYSSSKAGNDTNSKSKDRSLIAVGIKHKF